MCGLVSALAPGGVAPDRLRRATLALAARGPDGLGLWSSSDGTVGLGHTRLAVIDPVGGAQPIANEAGDLHIVVNGEFYGFEDQRRELEGRGHRFRTGSDSEVALHLYEEHGDEFLSRLRGEFALVLWDGRRRRMLAARDRFGIKPLCYARWDGQLWLASQAKALFAAGLPRAWDYPSLWHALSLQYPPPGTTLFAGVASLEPGCYLVAEAGTVRVRRYWDLDLPREPCGASVDELRALLQDAVRVRLRADVPVACHVSGGLDSSLILALAGTERCFTVGFEGGAQSVPYDEQAQAQTMADAVGARLDPLRLRAEDLTAAMSDAVWGAEGLAINGHLPAKYLLSRHVRDAGYRVVLTGEGADELFGGYPWFRADLGATVHGGVSHGIMTPDAASLPVRAAADRLGFVPAFLAAKASLGATLRPLLSAEFCAAHAELDPVRTLVEQVPENQITGRSAAQVSTYLWCKTALADYILRTLGDGTELSHGVEGRLPFLDHRLFECAREIPAAEHLRGKMEKASLREVARPWLPREVLERHKHPFYAPPISRTPEVLDMLAGQRLRECGIFDADALQAMLASPASVADDAATTLVLTAGILGDRFAL